MLDPRDQRPTQAVVSYSAQPLGFDLWSDDIDGPPAGTFVSRAASLGSTGQLQPRRHPQEQAQETERPPGPPPARCLQPARTLLRRLAAPAADPDPEPDPQPKRNQETSPRRKSQTPPPSSPA